MTNVIPCLVKYLHTEEKNWSLLKACIGLLRNLAFLSENLLILCECRGVYRIGQLLFQMKMISERMDLFVTTLFVFCQRIERFQKHIYDQMINSGCVEIIAQVMRKFISNIK